MKKRTLLWINLFLSFLILVAFLTVLGVNYSTHKILMEEAISDVSKLTSSTIYGQINDKLTKPLYVSQTMANDTFLKTWMKQEAEDRDNAAHLQEAEDYLLALKNKYDYDTAYVISAYTNTYYYYDGINKIVGQNSKHDQWYYRFVESGESYVLNVDEDEVNHGEPTVFIDSRMEDESGNFMGVTGVGVKLSEMQSMLEEFEEEYRLKAYLIRPDGSVSLHTDLSRINQVNVFEEQGGDRLKEMVEKSRDSQQISWLPSGALKSCVISRYIENLEWYLIIEKDTSELYHSFQSMFVQDLMVAIVVLIILLTLNTLGIRAHQQVLYNYSRIDELTGLHDRQYFLERFKKKGKRWQKGKAVFFLMDADHFKTVNDTYGHLMGNTVLRAIGKIIRDGTQDCGLAVRWGGDEFAGILFVHQEKAMEILEHMRLELAEMDLGIDTEVSLSIGFTNMNPGDTPEMLLSRADEALYAAKNKGRNCVSIYGE